MKIEEIARPKKNSFTFGNLEIGAIFFLPEEPKQENGQRIYYLRMPLLYTGGKDARFRAVRLHDTQLCDINNSVPVVKADTTLIVHEDQ